MDADGNAYAVWGDRRNGNDDIYFAYRPAGGDWGTNVKVNDDAGSAWQRTPSIAVDADGNAYAVWQDERHTTDHVYFSYAQHDHIANGPQTAIAVNTTSDVADGNTTSFADLLFRDPGPDGVISLREALLAANNMGGPKTITFAIPTSDTGYNPTDQAWTIQPSSPLPALTSGYIILDASTQGTSAYGGPAVELDGTLASTTAGIRIQSGYNTIRGFVINSFSGTGISLAGSDAISNTIAGNYIGTDIAGRSARPNANHGIVNEWGASFNRIGGTCPADRNVISGNNWHGVENWGDGTAHNVIQGNYIGVDASGTLPLGNQGEGVSITPSA
ncbi:MAG TPA: hypothetical protein EYP04_13430, partial [Anaerolineae bacterium]|nr:hypothetical protein [Anaerolineae bacterium]